MRVSAKQNGAVLTFDFQLESHDRDAVVAPDGKVKARFLAGEVRYHLPDGWRLEDTHPDLIACTALTVAGYFAVKEMVFPRPVSAEFVERISRVYRADFGPIDPALKPRQAPTNSRPALCFSGGVDSTSALALLPADTLVVFLERVDRPGQTGRSIYHKEAAVRACDVLREYGYDVARVQTDMEHSRDPVGFMNDGTMATPVMLLADMQRIDATAYGLILESSYLNKGFRFREYAQIDHWKRYGGNAAACDLSWHLLTAGLSEVSTSRLILESPFQHVAQSCVRGVFAEPCMKCWKCFRKSLLEAALLGETIPGETLDRLFKTYEASKKIREVPIKHENVMMYILWKYRGSNRRMLDLKRELSLDGINLDWMERWFTVSREVLAERYARRTEAAITRLIDPMTEQDLLDVRSWDRIAANEAAGRLAPAAV